MKKLELEKYLKLKSEEKKKYLASVAGNDKCRLIGNISSISESACVVNKLKVIGVDFEGHKEFRPFSNERGIRAWGSGLIDKELNENDIKKNDIVFLNLVPSSTEDEGIKRYFTIEPNSVVKAGDYPKLCKDLWLPEESSKVIKNFSYDQERNIILFEEDLKSAYEQALNEIDAKHAEQCKKNEQIEELKKDLLILTEEHTKNKENMENQLQQEFEQKKIQLEKDYKQKKQDLDKKIEEAGAVLSHLKKYRILDDDENQTNHADETEKMHIVDIKAKLQHIQGYMGCKKSLYYDISIIQSLYLGLMTDQIIILAGKPGSGKTSIVEAYAEAIDADMSLVPVQPNWIDKSDLLGFYNPIEKNYVPTPFLDAIINASKEASKIENKDKLFFIELDEMNLAHVEYYFAEFLSKLQTDRKIQLYSKNILEDIKQEIKDRNVKFKLDIENETIEEFLKEHTKENIDNYFKLKQQYKMLSRYPYRVEIPHNVKFLGTINKDETTKDLSPKVIDRCFLINLENGKKEEIKQKLAKETEGKKGEYCKKLDFAFTELNDGEVAQYEEIKTDLKEIEKVLKSHVSLSNRFEKAICQLWRKEGFTSKQILDTAIASLILPKVNISSAGTDIDIDSIYEELKVIFNNKTISKQVLEYMHSSDELTYWR